MSFAFAIASEVHTRMWSSSSPAALAEVSADLLVREPEIRPVNVLAVKAGRVCCSPGPAQARLRSGSPRGSPGRDGRIFGVVSRRSIRPAVARMVMASTIPRAAVAESGIR